MRGALILVFCGALSWLCPAPLFAHHSFATHYDSTRPMELVGTVVDFSMRSPHSFLYLEVESNRGELITWEIEMASVPLLRRQGFSAETFKLGDQVVVNVWLNRVENNRLVWGRGFVTAEGEALGAFPPTSRVESVHLAASRAERLQGRWRGLPVPMFDGNGSPLPLNPAGLAAVRTYDPQTSPANTCEANNVPATYHAPYQIEIRIEGSEAAIDHELYNVTRTVHLDSEPQPAEPTGLFGLATGRIDGDELVIESAGFPASGWGLGTAADALGIGTDIPSSEQKELLERFSVSDDGQTLTVSYTLEDPAYLTQPYVGTATLNRVADDEPLHPYECEMDSAERFSRDP
jgi:hypothetical protein